MVLKIQKISEDAVVPSYGYKGDAGLDFYSVEDVVLAPGERKLVKTGIKMEIPEGHTGLIWDRSGVATKHGIKTIAGVIDAHFRGEVLIALMNLSDKDFKIEKKQKIAQMIIQKFESMEIEVVDAVNESTERGGGGFGSSGDF